MLHILVIDDDEFFSDLLVGMLSRDGHHVTTAMDGDAGLKMLRARRPDLVITDILMPKMDGVQLITELQQMENPVPVIAMSGGRRWITAEFNLASAEMLGVKVSLVKPFEITALRAAVKTAIQ